MIDRSKGEVGRFDIRMNEANPQEDFNVLPSAFLSILLYLFRFNLQQLLYIMPKIT